MERETRYAKSGEVHIAYQVVGSGPIDLVQVPGFISHIEELWEDPLTARYLERLAGFSRLILFDKRGTGLSDRVAQVPTLEQRMDDVRAVLAAAGSERAAVLGVSSGGPMSLARRPPLEQKGARWPPSHVSGAEDGIRTRDPHLGKVMLYH